MEAETSQPSGDSSRLVSARELVALLERGDSAQADRLLNEIAGQRDFNLFEELGRMTRQLHEALTAFQTDTHIAHLAEEEIPDAKDRLNYVITMTEQAANRTLDMVEESIPLAQQSESAAQALHQELLRFRSREMPLPEFKVFCDDLEQFFERLQADSSALRANLSDVLMAQDYQDLTGQMIRRVIALVQEVEDNLVGLIKVSGSVFSGDERKPAATKNAMVLEGPQLHAEEREDVVSDQDDVDDLLSSLGF